MADVSPLHLTLEFGRVEKSGDPSEFVFTPQSYFLRTGPGSYDTALFPWTPETKADLEEVRRPGRDPAVVQRLGETLRRFLKQTDWASHEAEILMAVRERRPVILTMRSEAAELYSLPWELVTLRATGQFLGSIPSVVVRYEYPLTQSGIETPQPRPEGGRILFAYSGAVPATDHGQAIERACLAGGLAFDPAHDVLPHVSLKQLTAALESAQQAAKQGGRPISVLHLLCHGGAVGKTYGLVLDDADSPTGTVTVDAARMRQILEPFTGMVRLVVIAACDSGNSGALGNQLGSVAQTLHRVGVAQVVASRYPLSVVGSSHFAEKFYSELIENQSSVEQALVASRHELAKDASSLDWASIQLYERSEETLSRPLIFRPYRGFLPFMPEHRRFFFGREREVQELCERWKTLLAKQAPRLIVVDGVSGAGKSSFVLAGASQRLLQQLGPGSTAVRILPGNAPLQALAGALAKQQPGAPQLIIVEQLEELIVQTEDPAERTEFMHRLWALASKPHAPGQSESAVSVLMTLRTDFLHQLGSLTLDATGRRLADVLGVREHRQLLTPLREEQVLAAIVKPAQLVGLQLEAGLAERMLEDVKEEPGALPLLEHTLDLLWQERKGNVLTQAAYDELGGVAGALHAHADRLLDTLDAEDSKQARHLLLWLGTGWTSSHQGLRNRMQVAALRPTAQSEQRRFDRVLRRLVDERLLVLDLAQSGEELVEVAHETLLRRWKRLLSWVQEERPMLAARETVEAWVTEWRQRGTLLKDSQFGYIQEIAERHPDALSADARAMMAASEAERARIEERNRIARDAMSFLAADAAFGDDVTRLAAVMREAASKSATAIPGWWRSANDILHSELLTIAEIHHEDAVNEACFTRDGSTIATASPDGKLRFFRAPGFDRAVEFESPDGPLASVKLCQEANLIMTVSVSGVVRLHKGSDMSSHTLKGFANDAFSADFSSDGKRIVTGSADCTVRIWNAADGKQLQVLKGHEGQVRAVAFSPDGKRVASGGDDCMVGIWTLSEPQKPIIIGDLEPDETNDHPDHMELDKIYSLAWSPDGASLAVGTESGEVFIYPTRPKSEHERRGHESHEHIVWSLCFSPDGRELLSVSQDRVGVMWSVTGAHPPYYLLGHATGLTSGYFDSTGTRIITSSGDGAVRIWDASRSHLTHPTLWSDDAYPARGYIWAGNAAELAQKKITSPDGAWSAQVQSSGAIALKQLIGGNATGSLPAAGTLTAMSFTPDSQKLVLISDDKQIRVHTLGTDQVLALKGHSQPIISFHLSSDSRWLITGSADWTARIWDLNGTVETRVLSGHHSAVSVVAFCDDNKVVLTAENGGATRFWPESGPPLLLLAADRPDHLVAVNPSFTELITQCSGQCSGQSLGQSQSIFYLWETEYRLDSIIARLTHATPLQLTAKERESAMLPPLPPAS